MRSLSLIDNFLLATLLISSVNAASVNLPDYHEALLEAPITENKEKGEVFLEELDTSRKIHQRPVDLSGDDKEMKDLVKDMALQIRPSNILTMEDEAEDSLRH